MANDSSNASDSEKPRPPNVSHERLSLEKAAVLRLASWGEDLKDRFWGKTLSKSDLINFLVLTHPASLSEAQISSLQGKHFDPVRALEWAARRAKEALGRGEKIDLRAFVEPAMKVSSKAPSKTLEET